MQESLIDSISVGNEEEGKHSDRDGTEAFWFAYNDDYRGKQLGVLDISVGHFGRWQSYKSPMLRSTFHQNVR